MKHRTKEIRLSLPTSKRQITLPHLMVCCMLPWNFTNYDKCEKIGFSLDEKQESQEELRDLASVFLLYTIMICVKLKHFNKQFLATLLGILITKAVKIN